MKAYSEDLRQKIVIALERGTSKAQAARLFDVSLSSLALREEGTTEELPRAEERLRKTPKLDENAGRLLEENIQERPAATVEQRRHFLEHLTGKTLSNSTARRLLKRLGFSRKKGLWGRWSETIS